MTTRADIIAEARTWLGTPFVHQARSRGVGVDCIGLIVGAVQGCGLAVDDRADYARTPHAGELARELGAQLERIDVADAAPGDVVLIAWRRAPMHVGLLTDYPHSGLALLHAIETIGRVVEHRLDDGWRRLIVAAYRVPGLED